MDLEHAVLSADGIARLLHALCTGGERETASDPLEQLAARAGGALVGLLALLIWDAIFAFIMTSANALFFPTGGWRAPGPLPCRPRPPGRKGNLMGSVKWQGGVLSARPATTRAHRPAPCAPTGRL